MNHNKMPGWQQALRMREGTLFRDDLDDTVAQLPYWMRQKLRVWLREQDMKEPEPGDNELLDFVRSEVSALLPLVPPDELRRLLQIVRLYAGGR